MTRCRIPQFCERYKEGIGICDLKSKKILARSIKGKTFVFTFIKTIVVLFGKQ